MYTVRLPHASHFSPTCADVVFTQGLPAMTEEVNLLNGELTTCMEQVEQFQARRRLGPCTVIMRHCRPLIFV